MREAFTFDELRLYSDSVPFHRWAGIELVSAEEGRVALRMRWRDEFGQHHRGLHAGLICGLLEPACGYASFTLSGPALVTHMDVAFLNPAYGEVFLAKGRIMRDGRRQIFAEAELRANSDGPEPHVIATARALLVPALVD